MKTKIFTFLLLICLLSCKKEEVKKNEITYSKSLIEGYVQKGPFLNGSSIDVYELKEDLSQTGKAYSSQILDNTGRFELKNIDLVSQYVYLKGQGFYFNEVTGENSNAQITLNALSDISNTASLNVNVLSHLEKGRVEFLVSSGLDFISAKTKARREILDVFAINDTVNSEFSNLDISKDGDDNAILLAVSLITQGYRSVSELSDLLASINTDMREDGILNSSSLQSKLINHARLFNLEKIRNQIESRYLELGMTVTIPNFEKYINFFVDNSGYTITNQIIYPLNGKGLPNLLSSQNTITESGYYSITAELPTGTSLKVVFSSVEGYSYYWGYNGIGLTTSGLTLNGSYPNQQSFISNSGVSKVELGIKLMQPGAVNISVYENGSNIVTSSRTIIWE